MATQRDLGKLLEVLENVKLPVEIFTPSIWMDVLQVLMEHMKIKVDKDEHSPFIMSGFGDVLLKIKPSPFFLACSL